MKFREEIRELDKTSKTTQNFKEWDLELLVDHIVDVHHKYVEEASQQILQCTNEALKVHGPFNSLIVEIDGLFNELARELAGHMKKEELILFPFIKNLAEADRLGVKINQPYFGSLKNPIEKMENEHDVAGNLIKSISKITSNFNPPENASSALITLYKKLKEFQDDLFIHIILENNVLFPRAIKLEEEFISE